MAAPSEIAIEGLWSSSEGDIRFQQHGNRIAGRYTKDNGEITGTLGTDTLNGFWIEDSSNQRCSTPKNGRYYWGRLELRFSGTAFSGKWGYCNGALTGNWTGSRK
jgi:heat shock protein HslJ